jgi:2'-deoxynucleoside 5'-phosphate N-hydrolase
MTVYLACTVRGHRGALQAARAVNDALLRQGHHVLTTHLLADDADAAESALTEHQVYERDIHWLERADLLIAEASGSSYGVGFEVGYVLGRSAETGQRALVVFDESRRPAISRMIAGASHPACTVRGYNNPQDLLQVVEDYLSAWHASVSAD